MPRTVSDLESNGVGFWPEGISESERKSSIIPRLIETQDKFISLLNIADKGPFAWKTVLETTEQLPVNLFLKHLMVLSDISGEKLMRFKTALPEVFLHRKMEFVWRSQNYIYTFQTLSEKRSGTTLI